jgi:hypothetical protein
VLGQQPVFCKRGARPAPPATSLAPAPSAAYLEVAAAAREAFLREPEARYEDARGLASASAESADDLDMRAYIGSNWRAYRPLWLKMKTAPGLRPSRSIAAALLTSIWLLYRKQYRLGAVILAALLAMTWAALEWSPVFDVVVAVFLGRYGKSIVVLKGISKIESIRAAAPTPKIAAMRIGGAGGSNFIAAILGALLLLGGWAFLAAGESGPTTDEFEALRAITEQFRTASPSN